MGLHILAAGVVGAAIGSLATYIYIDKSSREKISSAAQNASDKVKSVVKGDKAEENAESTG